MTHRGEPPGESRAQIPLDAAAQQWLEVAITASGRTMAGAPELVKQRAWATVVRVETLAGEVYFKANAPGGRHEPGLVAALAAAWPEHVPAPLAVDVERGWMLSAGCGRRLDQEIDPTEAIAWWQRLLPRYAELQIESGRTPERWLGLGVPDRRVERLPSLAESLLRDCPDLAADERAAMRALLPELTRCCELLASSPSAAALEHGDLHAGNVLVGAGGT